VVVTTGAPRTRWPTHFTVLLLLCAATFISYIDRSNISVGAIAMQARFGWNETQKGLVLSSFFVGYIAMMAASGALAHRFGGRLVLGMAVIWCLILSVMMPYWHFRGKQNSTGEAYRVKPADFVKRVETFVKVNTGTESLVEDGIAPVVPAPCRSHRTVAPSTALGQACRARGEPCAPPPVIGKRDTAALAP
jgi:hypothetical protein